MKQDVGPAWPWNWIRETTIYSYPDEADRIQKTWNSILLKKKGGFSDSAKDYRISFIQGQNIQYNALSFGWFLKYKLKIIFIRYNCFFKESSQFALSWLLNTYESAQIKLFSRLLVLLSGLKLRKCICIT